jgi:inosine/xanthosine triphosphate pyrophosphatase family protein
MELKNIKFLTSNTKKAEDFTNYGLGVKQFEKDIPEVLDKDVEIVVLHKARDTGLTNIVVEDTSLSVDGADFLGTEIKHVYQEIEDNESFNNHKTIWAVSLCMKRNETYYISTGKLEGILKYPALDVGYHFDRIFAIPDNNGQHIQFELLSKEKKLEVGPRFQALRKLTNAIKNNDYSDLLVIHEKDIKDWTGKYQKEKLQSKKLKV